MPYGQWKNLSNKDVTPQKIKFSIRDFFSKCDQIRRKRIWSHLLKKSLMENFIFCEVGMPLKSITSVLFKETKYCMMY